MGVRDVLEGMLEVLGEKEWIQGTMFRGDFTPDSYLLTPPLNLIKGVCLEGACNLVLLLNEDPVFDHLAKLSAQALILDAAKALFPGKFEGMTAMFQFNDCEGVTREDVILAVKHAIGSCD